MGVIEIPGQEPGDHVAKIESWAIRRKAAAFLVTSMDGEGNLTGKAGGHPNILGAFTKGFGWVVANCKPVDDIIDSEFPGESLQALVSRGPFSLFLFMDWGVWGLRLDGDPVALAVSIDLVASSFIVKAAQQQMSNQASIESFMRGQHK